MRSPNSRLFIGLNKPYPQCSPAIFEMSSSSPWTTQALIPGRMVPTRHARVPPQLPGFNSRKFWRWAAGGANQPIFTTMRQMFSTTNYCGCFIGNNQTLLFIGLGVPLTSGPDISFIVLWDWPPHSIVESYSYWASLRYLNKSRTPQWNGPPLNSPNWNWPLLYVFMFCWATVMPCSVFIVKPALF